MPLRKHQAGGPRASTGLAHGHGAGQAGHASAASARRHSWPQDPRDRRGVDPQGTHLPDRRERPCPPAPHLVRGTDRSEPSLDACSAWLGPKKSRKITLAVMDMWKAFAASTAKPDHAPAVALLFDKFHVMRHLGEALDRVRRSESQRLSGKDRAFVKGQRYNLLSRREHRSLDGRKALRRLLAANKRLHTAYLLKESLGQLWDYRREGWARRFFDNWEQSLKWQRLKAFEKFAATVEVIEGTS